MAWKEQVGEEDRPGRWARGLVWPAVGLQTQQHDEEADGQGGVEG